MTRAIALAFLSGLLLTGCGSSESTPTPAAPSPAPAPAPAPAPTAARLDLTASPARFLSGSGTTAVTITGRLTSAAGTGLGNQTVQFATNAGSLSATFPTTAANGEATVTLTTSTSATVVASSGPVAGSVNVQAVAPFTIVVDPKYSVVGFNEEDEVFVTVTPAVGFPNIPTPTSVVLDCGNGITTTIGDRKSWPCKYTEKGTYQVTVTATAPGGFTATGRATITFEPRPITLTLTARAKGSDATSVEYEFTVVGAPDRSVCKWDLGTTKPSVTACHLSINYDFDEGDDNGNIKVTVDVDTRQGQPIEHLEIVIKLD